jgi:hypothetical protein
MNIADEKTILLIKQLSNEDGKTPEKFVSDLINKEDSERHIHWSRKAQAHVRAKCPRKTCIETVNSTEMRLK